MISFFDPTAWAQAAGEAPQQPGFIELIGMPLAFLVIMYLLVLRPQQKRQRSHQDLLTKLKVGDEVVTSGGIIARIKSVSDQFVTVDTGSSTVLKIQKQHITSFTEKANATSSK